MKKTTVHVTKIDLTKEDIMLMIREHFKLSENAKIIFKVGTTNQGLSLTDVEITDETPVIRGLNRPPTLIASSDK